MQQASDRLHTVNTYAPRVQKSPEPYVRNIQMTTERRPHSREIIDWV